jgi:SAM-dependent methyltransferase
MDIRLMTSKIVAHLRERGAVSATKTIGRGLWRKLREAPVDDFDQRHGTDTSGELALWEMTVMSSNARLGIRYQASAENDVVQVVNSLGIDATNFTFIDLGCGKGRTLLVAARLGFRQVIGVEIGAELVEIARANLAKLNVPNALVIYGDAAEYVLPSGALVVYLANPFDAPVVSQVVHRLEHRIERCKADAVYVAYKRPTCARLLDRSKFLRRLSAADVEDIAFWQGPAL